MCVCVQEEDELKPVTWHPNTIKILGFLRKHFEATERRDRRKGVKVCVCHTCMTISSPIAVRRPSR